MRSFRAILELVCFDKKITPEYFIRGSRFFGSV